MLLLGAASASAAEGSAETGPLLRQSKTGETPTQADSLAARNPGDSQDRLLKGIALAEQGRTNEAVAVFLGLTRDFPSLPEPYNNLAVLYARQNQFDKARAALEAAIRTHPSYATAHQNLGDLYAQMASQAYGKALQTGNGRSAPPPAPQLALIAEIAPAFRLPPAAANAPPQSAAPSPAASRPTIEPSLPTVSAQAQLPAVTTETASASADVLQTAKNWAQAWSAKDVQAYLAFYGHDFDVPGKRSREDWEREREQNISKGGPISVQIENPRIAVDGAHATVRFRQHYRSAGFNGSTAKTLEFVLRDNIWRIRRERIGG